MFPRSLTALPVDELTVETGGDSGKFTVMLIECRDEVYARLAGDLSELGLRVVRATDVSEAASTSASLIIVNGDQLTESVWLHVAKVRLSRPQACIWVYVRRSTNLDVRMANVVSIEELIDYEDDRSRLADEIRIRLAEY